MRKEMIEIRRHILERISSIPVGTEISLDLGSHEKAISERNMLYRAINYLDRNPEYDPELADIKQNIKASITRDRPSEIVFTRREVFEISAMKEKSVERRINPYYLSSPEFRLKLISVRIGEEEYLETHSGDLTVAEMQTVLRKWAAAFPGTFDVYESVTPLVHHSTSAHDYWMIFTPSPDNTSKDEGDDIFAGF